MGHADESGKPPNDAPWEVMCQRLSRPISASLLTGVLSVQPSTQREEGSGQFWSPFVGSYNLPKRRTMACIAIHQLFRRIDSKLILSLSWHSKLPVNLW